MKKLLLVLVFSLFIICGCVKKSYHEIGLNRLEDMINNKETFIMYIGSSTCSNCASLNPTLNRVINDYDVDVYYIDTNKLSDAEKDELIRYINYEKKTPRIYFITNGSYDNMNLIKGNQAYETLVKEFMSHGYIEVEK